MNLLKEYQSIENKLNNQEEELMELIRRFNSQDVDMVAKPEENISEEGIKFVNFDYTVTK